MSILTRIFAVIGLIVTLLVVAGLVLAFVVTPSAPQEPDSVVLTLDFDRPIVEQTSPLPFDLSLHDEPDVPLIDIIHAIDAARDDPHVKALVAKFGDTSVKLSQAQEIAAAVARFRTSGKPTYAFGSSYGDFGPGDGAYYLASGFENIWLQPVGAVGLMSLDLEAPFGKTALDKIGVQGDFLRREEYKSVMENVTRDNFSDPVRANMQALVDDLSDQVAGGIAGSRQWDPAKVKQLMGQGPFTASEALKAGLVTAIGYDYEMMGEIRQKFGKDVKEAGVGDYVGYGGAGASEKAKATIALIYGTGMITAHDVGPPDLTGEDIMGADSVADAFNDAADDDKVKAIIFRVDSPGGSPGASETIRAALLHAQKKGKPVFVSMGSMAASGGYWISMSADHITAEPGTLTGSIGVVAGKFVLGGLMEKLGIHWDHIDTGGNAGMWSMLAPFDAAGQARVNALLNETYADFTAGVSEARKIPPEKMADIAKGRVFTGAQAQRIGLVDDLGGFDVTLGDLRQKLGLTPDDHVDLVVMPAPLTPTEKLMKLLKNMGVESLALNSAFQQSHGLRETLAPFLSALTDRNPVSARAPLINVH